MRGGIVVAAMVASSGCAGSDVDPLAPGEVRRFTLTSSLSDEEGVTVPNVEVVPASESDFFLDVTSGAALFGADSNDFYEVGEFDDISEIPSDVESCSWSNIALGGEGPYETTKGFSAIARDFRNAEHYRLQIIEHSLSDLWIGTATFDIARLEM